MGSDVDVSRWVIELFVRDREKECIAKRVLAAAPLSDQDYRLKKTVLLRTIECDVYDASVTETMLETLECIEDLDIREGNSTMDSMKAAYLAVATECTVKFLVGLMGKPSGKYVDAVDRIWRGRIGILERSGTSELVSAELRQKMEEVEAGVWDLTVSKKLCRMNTRNNALRLVALYVKEALALMGPPFITWAVRLSVPKEVADLEGDQITVANVCNVGGGSEVEDQTGNGANMGGRSELEVPMENRTNLSLGSELEAHIPNVENLVDMSEVEAQMADGPNASGESELEVQMAKGAKVGDGSELEGQMVNVGDRSELEAQMANVPNVSGESELEVQMSEGGKVGDGSELEGQMVNRTNEDDGSQLQVQATNGTNAVGESVQEAQMVSEAIVRDGSELEVVNGINVGDGSQLEDSQNVIRTNVGNESHFEEQTTNGIGVVGEPELDAQPGCEFQGQILKEANVSFGSELGPEPMTGVELQEVGAGSSSPTVGRRLVSNNFVEMDSGFRNSEARKLADDNARSELNGTGVALPSASRELALCFDHTPKEREVQRSFVLRHKHLAHKRTRGRVKIRDAEDLDEDLSKRKCNFLSTPEVSKAQEALKSSTLVLQAVVTDPLPDCLRVADIVRSDLATKSSNDVDEKHAGAENSSVEKGAEPVQSHNYSLGNMFSSRNDGPQSSGKEKDIPNPPVNQGKGTESVQIDNANRRNPLFIIQNNVCRPSLFERNTTAHTYEWQDSIDTSQEGTREDTSKIHLPNPKRNVVSPLKKYEDKRVPKRRKVKRWTLMEEDALRNGVNKYGAGNWKFILNCYRDIFEERTEVDLKDKWRNMTR